MKLLLYCTRQKPYLMNLNTKYFISSDRESLRYIDKQDMKSIALNGKIVAECDFEVEEIYYLSFMNEDLRKRIYKESCLSDEELDNYMNGHDTMYAIHLKNLHTFNNPRKLKFYHNAPILMCLLENAPQNMMYVYDYKGGTRFEKKVLISIRPEWLCKILNGEKTIEVRKKVLKVMLENDND